MSDLWLFVAGLVAVYLIPGPDMLLVLDATFHRGRFNAFMIAAGLAASRAIHVTLSGAGLALMQKSFPWVFQLVHYAGGAFLIWMAIGLVRTRVFYSGNEEVAGNVAMEERPLIVFSRGFFTNLLNPKALLFCSVFLPQFVSDGAGYVWLQYIVLGVILVGMGFLFDLAFILAGSAMERFFANAVVQSIQRWGFALVFLCTGMVFIFDAW